VQRERPLHAVQAAGGDHVQGATGLHLLGSLEDQPDPAGQVPGPVQVGQHQAGAQHRRGVHVVAAGVRDALDGGAEREGGLLLHRQRVQVPPQRDQRTGGADVAEQPGAGKRAGVQAGQPQPLHHLAGCPHLLPAQLGVHVQVPPEVQQLAVVGGEAGGQVRAAHRTLRVRRATRSAR
jgi:hypothetical protein